MRRQTSRSSSASSRGCMDSETRRGARRIAVVPAAALSALIIGSIPARAAAAWWSPVSLRGVAVTRVSAAGDTITVRTAAGATLTSSDAGKTFSPGSGSETFPPTGTVTVGNQVWSIAPNGGVRHAGGGGAPVPDPGAPHLGAGADLIASPAALPGVVVAAGTDGTVWRRGQDGDWEEGLLPPPHSPGQ